MTNKILPLLSLFAAAAIFFAYINPTWQGPIAAEQTVIASDNQALAAASEYVTRQNELASARDAIDPTELAKLEAFLPDSVDNVSIILDLDALASRSGLALSKVDVSSASTGGDTTAVAPSSSNDPVGSVDLSMSATGSYSAFRAFLAGIESSQRLLDVEGLDVGGSSNGVYTYQMTLRLYWLH